MNWKKEGYFKGQEVFLVGANMFVNDNYSRTGTVIHAGTKILKVEVGCSKKIMEFRNSNYTSDKQYGFGYRVYKSKEEYEIAKKKADDRYFLRKRAEKALGKLTNEQLEQIIKWSKDR